jgi:hypothetical protein
MEAQMKHPLRKLFEDVLWVILFLLCMLVLGTQPARGLDVKIHCKAWDYPRIKCEASYTPWKPKWYVYKDDAQVEFDQQQVVFLTVPSDWVSISVYHGDVHLSSFKARWNNRKIEFRK